MNTQTIINLTPHDINVISDTGNRITYPRSNTMARVFSTSTRVGQLEDGTPLFRTSYGEVEGLPDPQDNTIYIVSSMIRSRLPERTDLASPCGLVRDSDGNIIGCSGLDVS